MATLAAEGDAGSRWKKGYPHVTRRSGSGVRLTRRSDGRSVSVRITRPQTTRDVQQSSSWPKMTSVASLRISLT